MKKMIGAIDDRPEDVQLEAIKLGYKPTLEQCESIISAVGDSYVGNSELLASELQKMGLKASKRSVKKPLSKPAVA